MIGVVGGGFKPFTKGHYFLVVQAAKENDNVLLFVSTKNRTRRGEFPLFFEPQMRILWERYFSQILPENVEVRYVSNPTTAVYSLLGEASDHKQKIGFTLYGDEKDLEIVYPEQKLEKYIPFLYENKLIKKKPFSRSKHVDISGTEMRKCLADERFADFASGLPVPVQKHSREIFDILRSV